VLALTLMFFTKEGVWENKLKAQKIPRIEGSTLFIMFWFL